ncbi:hypothetical protein V492_08318 [Pseudogymnoascus sp. VKM F-4246]|nr:hypothetical protein V492_08318 [Pseudogymnoascus sp. VKM F-4246]
MMNPTESGKYLEEHYADDVANLKKYVIYARNAFFFCLLIIISNAVGTYFLIMHPSRFPCVPNAELCAACADANPAWTDVVPGIWAKLSTVFGSIVMVCYAVHIYNSGGRI